MNASDPFADTHIALLTRYPYSDQLFELLPFGIVFQNPDGQIMMANTAAKTLLGLSLSQMQGVTSTDPRWRAVHEDGSPFPGAEHPAMVTLRTHQAVRDVIMGVFNPQRDDDVWIRVSAFPIKGADTLLGVYAIFEDISAQHREQIREHAIEARFQAVFHAMSEGMALHQILCDARGRAEDYRILDVNPAFERQTGIRRVDAVGCLASELYGTGAAPFLDRYAEVAQSGQPQVFNQFFAPLQKHFLINVFSPEPQQFATIFEDITPHMQMEQQLRATRDRLQSTLNAIPDLLFEMGLDGRYYDYYTHRTELLAAPPEAFLGRLTTEVLPPDAAACCLDALQEANQHGFSSGRTYSLTLGDESKWFELSIARKQGETDAAPRFIVLSRDITERKRLEVALQQQATTDGLTGLVNRRHFLALAQDELKRARRFRHPLAITLIDIDHFKLINDSYGHAVGDQALLRVANIFQTHLREIDIAARLGGDEFVLLLPEADHQQAYQATERIRQALADTPLDCGALRMTLNISAGIAALTLADGSFDALLGRADHALYQAKADGRSCSRIAPGNAGLWCP